MKIPSSPSHSLLLLVITALAAGSALAAPYGSEGRTVDWSQPTGEKLKLRVFGDDYYARTETADGYTVIYSEQSGAYHYAIPAANGKGLTISGVKAHLPPHDGLAKHLESTADEIQTIRDANWVESAEGERAKRWTRRTDAARLLRNAKMDGRPLNVVEADVANINAAPVVGDLVGLTILVQFPDDSKTNSNDPVSFPVSRTKIENFCNEKGYREDDNSGSVRDYFFDQSLGRLTYTQDVPQIVTLPKPRNYYNYSDYPANRKLWGAGAAGRLLVEDALQELLNQNFDFSKLSTDSNGNVIATNLMWAGKDSGVWAKGLWPHQYRLSSAINVGTPGSPIKILNYQATNIENTSPVIGTFCHENGHLICDYPDIYDIRGEGVGEHCLMGSGNHLGNGKTPSPINAYFRDLVGWENVTDLTPDEFVTHSLPTTGNMAFRILKPSKNTEFFIVENRGSDDKWAEKSPDQGIAIWHIDETINGNVSVRPHYMVSLEQADGKSDLEKGNNRGDSGDLFDVTDPLFANSTTPNSDWWSFSNSSVRIEVLDPVGSSMRVRFGALPVDVILVDSPNGGELVFLDTPVEIIWDANITGNVNIDLFKGGVLDSVIAADIPNTGTYTWTTPKNQQPGKDYTIRISSVTNAIPTFDDSDAPFTISDETFPPGESLPYGWYQPATANIGFEVTSSESYEGKTSLANQTLGDGKKAGIAYTSNFLAGTLTFRLKCSTEAEFDFATFYIDGVQQVLSTQYKGGLTGEVDWTTYSFAVDRGNHTFEWFYKKDDSYGDGQDTVWLDGVTLPATSQEIAVKHPAHEDLTSDNTIIDFPSVGVDSESPYKTFTIRNTGRADLQDLKVVIDGPDLQSFKPVQPDTTVLNPGKITTFRVKFAPDHKGFHEAKIKIFSNDGDESPFVITVTGTGLPEVQPRTTTSSMSLAQAVLGTTPEDSGDMTKPLVATDLIGGRKYLTLTVAKSALPNRLEPTVEVSPNLVDWFSGRKHTTAVLDTPALLKVRDNTPITPGHKRYIRLAPKAP